MGKISLAEKRRRNAGMKKIRDARRDLGICINQPTKGPPHGAVFKGGRCRACWETKKASS